ncbi:MAG: MMPL family transporter, partial [Gammaproteobacteria bacterium]|nr:MMPL family transporter [Gammaproteobacteria bacterium]
MKRTKFKPHQLLRNASSQLLRYYFEMVLKHPAITLLIAIMVIGYFGYFTTSFRLDASADTLVLENDKSLDYYRSIRARYGSDDFLIITYSPIDELFSGTTLSDLHSLRDELLALDRIESVISLLDVPLIQSPPVGLRQLSHEIPTLDSPRTDKEQARVEFLSSPMYRNLIISADGRTTAMQVNFQLDGTWHRLLEQRNRLREQRLHSDLSPQQNTELATLSRQFNAYNAQLQDQQKQDITAIRDIMHQYRVRAELHLGGVPMIASDSIDYIQHDLTTFGIGVLCFLILILSVTFRKPRWIILPMLICLATGVLTVGFLGLADWPVTVVSSNFISLLLIITLSLNVHLIVRYRELHELSPDMGQYELVKETLCSKAAPCF